MRKSSLAGTGLGILIMLLIPFGGCKKGVETAAQPLKKQAEEHYTQARRLFLTCDPDKYPDAMKEYQLALTYWDEYPEALAGLAETISMWRGFSVSEQEFGQAYQFAQRALRLNPKLAEGYRAMADLFRHRKENERALRMINKALEFKPNDAENLYVKGSVLLDSNPEEAFAILAQAKRLNPDLPKIYFNLASACHKLGQFDEAIHLLAIYQKTVPSDVAGYCSLAMVYLNKSNAEKSEATKKELLDTAIENLKLTIAKSDVKNKPWHASWALLSLKMLANINLGQANYQEALDYLKKAEEIFPEESEVHYLYGLAYKGMGNKNLAKTHLKKSLSLAPDANPEVQEMIKRELERL